MKETQVWFLGQKDLTYHGTTKFVHHNYWACVPEPQDCNYCGYVMQLLKPMHPRAQAPQQEKPPQWEALPPQLESSPHSPQLEESLHSKEDPAWSKIF